MITAVDDCRFAVARWAASNFNNRLPSQLHCTLVRSTPCSRLTIEQMKSKIIAILLFCAFDSCECIQRRPFNDWLPDNHSANSKNQTNREWCRKEKEILNSIFKKHLPNRLIGSWVINLNAHLAVWALLRWHIFNI